MSELERCELMLPVDSEGTPVGPVVLRQMHANAVTDRTVAGTLEDAARLLRADGWRFVYGERRREHEGRCLVVLEWERGARR